VLTIHRELVEEFRGTLGIRDANALDSALARPLNRHAYGVTLDICQLAAAYGYGLCCNHPLVDGNKRAAFMAMYVFLRLNGIVMKASEVDAVAAMESLASGSMSEDELAEWLRENTRKRSRRRGSRE
jgi:death-on-curing protein